MKRRLGLIVIIVIGFVITRLVNTPTEPEPSNPEIAGELYLVTNVIDGDTITVNKNGSKETVRLLGIDTPEVDISRGPVECFGKEASEKTASLLAGQSVSLETDPTQAQRDTYNRLLAYVYTADGALVNKLLIESGFAREYTYDKPYTYRADFQAAEKSARTEERGIWSKDHCPN